MSRLLPLLVVAALLIGADVALAGPRPSPASATSESATLSATSTPSSADWNVAGTIQQMNGQFWTVQGFVFAVTDQTHIVGDVPTVGTYAAAAGTVAPDGTWIATSIQVGSAATASPSPSATPTVAPSATPTSSPTSTATSIPTATATAPAAPPPATPALVNPRPPSDDEEARPAIIPPRNGHGDGSENDQPTSDHQPPKPEGKSRGKHGQGNPGNRGHGRGQDR